MSIKDFARIEFLQSGFGNDVGDVVKVVLETDGEVYYYDGFRRYCYVNKSEEGVSYRYIPKGERANKRLHSDAATVPLSETKKAVDSGLPLKVDE